MKNPSSKNIKSWRFFLPLILQTALIIAVPAQAFYTYVTGKTVILQTQPVDPYDLLRGYSQTLSYTISNTNNLTGLKGWKELLAQSTKYEKNSYQYQNDYLPVNTKFYVILEAPTNTLATPPFPWKPIAVSANFPENLPQNQIAIEGVADYSWVKYDLETYYFPEARREEINNKIREIQGNQNQQQSFVVEIKVDQKGNAVPISLWLGKENYRF
jgi:uncharacterized membrane-anchored protein